MPRLASAGMWGGNGKEPRVGGSGWTPTWDFPGRENFLFIHQNEIASLGGQSWGVSPGRPVAWPLSSAHAGGCRAWSGQEDCPPSPQHPASSFLTFIISVSASGALWLRVGLVGDQSWGSLCQLPVFDDHFAAFFFSGRPWEERKVGAGTGAHPFLPASQAWA